MSNKTGELLPEFKISLLNGGSWSSSTQPLGSMLLLTVYRGMWCGHCKTQLQSLERLQNEFAARGVDILAVSADTEARASAMAKDYGLFRLAIGYEMPIDRARAMGVFISKREKDIEMPLFCEPATFLINNQSKVQAAWIASTAFARVLPDDILSYVDFLAKHSDRDPRGSS